MLCICMCIIYPLTIYFYTYRNKDNLVSTLHSFVNSSTLYNRIVVSVCSGRAETESHSQPGDVCLCLDVDLTALFASKVADYFKWKRQGKRNIISGYHNMKEGLRTLLHAIKSQTNLPVHVLFQHLAPSSDPTSKAGKKSRDVIASASKDCISALQEKMVESVHYVYDYNSSSSKTTWKGDDLKRLATSKCDPSVLGKLEVTNPVTICGIDEDQVNHPLFGVIPRCGWALLKKGGCEMAFSITNNSRM